MPIIDKLHNSSEQSIRPFHLPPTEKLAVADETPEGGKAKPKRAQLVPKVEEYNKLVREYQATWHRIDHLRAEHTKAEELDHLALARAIREGKPDPGNAKVQKVEQQQKDAKRKAAALFEAIVEIEAELHDAFDEAREPLEAATEVEIAEAAEVYRDALAALRAARLKLTEAVAMKRFLKNFDEDQDYRVFEWPVYKLQTPSGDPYFAGDVFDALAFDIDAANGAPLTKGPVYLGGNGPWDTGSAVSIVGDTPEEPYYEPGTPEWMNERQRILKSVGP